MEKNFNPATEWRSQIPVPICDSSPEFIELYWKAWELAHDHIIDLPGMPQTPYMDEAFSKTNIWIWDSCFMSLFCKYAQDRFPGVETFNNFYQVLYGDAKLPIVTAKNGPDRIRIHILDNPPLFAWAEHCNALFSGDLEHLRDLLLKKKYLQQHYQRLETLPEHYYDSRLRADTWLRKHEIGYFWEGGRSGMDNTPRGRVGGHALAERPNNPKMLWIDAIAQQGLNALEISRLAKLIGDQAMHEQWFNRYEHFKTLVNENYWDDKDGFYYDIHADSHDFMRVMTPASFWPVIAEMATPEQVERMCEKLTDPAKLGGEVPCLSLARDDADFYNNGHYWRGSLWIPTAYMVLKGIEKYGKFPLAQSLSEKILHHMARTYREFEPHTIWECYNPTIPEPAVTCDSVPVLVRRDFCGRSALAPISLLIENVIGIHSVDAFNQSIKWYLPESCNGKLGVKNLRFGDTTTSLEYNHGICTVVADSPYTLTINFKDYPIHAGEQHFSL